MDNYRNIDIYPVSEQYIEKAIDFNEINKKEIEDIKNIFLDNLNEFEKNKFINIINAKTINEKIKKDIQIIDDYNPEKSIKEYISISMINSKNEDLYDIILFIPTDDDNVKTKINEYINKNNNELINNIIYGSISLYKKAKEIEEI
jgi:hypothetical protein